MSKAEVIEAKIHAIGAELFAATKGTHPSLFDKGYWNGKILDYCMAHEGFKVEMFRFVDVLPMIKDAESVARHVKEYFGREGLDFPAAVKTAMLGATAFGGIGAKMAAGTIEKNVIEMAKRFVVATNPTEATCSVRRPSARPRAMSTPSATSRCSTSSTARRTPGATTTCSTRGPTVRCPRSTSPSR